MNHLLFLESGNGSPLALVFPIILLAIFIIGIVTIIRWLGKRKYNDVVILKNGSVIHGKIVEQNPNVSIKIETKDKNIMVFKNEEIEKITKD